MLRSQISTKATLVVVVLAASVGCQNNHEGIVPVSGTVTIDGKPLTVGQVRILAKDHRPAMEMCIRDSLSAVEGITDLGVDFILPDGFRASIVDATDLVLSVGLQGDFNGDGVVNIADYTVWRNNLGAVDETPLMGNGDGVNGVDAGDYALWKANFGNGLLGASAVSEQSAVPEPTTWLTLVFGLAALVCLRSRQKMARVTT